MRKAIFKIIVVLIVLLRSIMLYGCMRIEKVEKQTEYHESVSELEEYVLNEMGDYISFKEPSIDEDNITISWGIYFVSDYYNDESQKQTYSPLDVMEDTRHLINDFLLDNPNYFINNYRVVFSIAAIPEGNPYDCVEQYGKWENKLYDNNPHIEEYVCNVIYDKLIDRETVDTIDCSGIKEIDLSLFTDVEEVLYIIDQMPDLEVVVVYSDLENEVSEQWPDLRVIGVKRRV